MIKKKSAIIVDIDGTIAHNNGHRKFYEWSKVGMDTPITGVIRFLEYVCPKIEDLTVIFVSGRMDCCFQETVEWIGTELPQVGMKFHIYMRETDNYQPDEVIKEEIYRKYVEPYFDVIAVFDDRNKVVKMWREIGLTCFQVADGDF